MALPAGQPTGSGFFRYRLPTPVTELRLVSEEWRPGWEVGVVFVRQF
jgi:hypothetical protein